MDTKTKIIIISALLLFSIISMAFTVYFLFFRNEYSNVNIINVSTAPIESDQERSDDETENIQKDTDIDDEEGGTFVSSDNSDYSVGYRQGRMFKPKYKKWVCDKAKNIIDNEPTDDSDDDILGSCEYASNECKKYATCTADSDVKSGCAVASYDNNGVQTLYGCPADCCKKQVRDIRRANRRNDS